MRIEKATLTVWQFMMAKTKVAVAGSGTSAEVLLAHLAEDDRFEATLVVADTPAESGTSCEFYGLPVVSPEQFVHQGGLQTVGVFMAVGYRDLNRNREKFYRRLLAKGINFLSYVHPSAVVSRSAILGRGSIVLAGSVVEPLSRVGENSVIWTNCTIAHHATVGDHCWIAAGTIISGHAEICHNSFVGVGCTVTNRVTIREFSILGAGVKATQDVPPRAVLLEKSSERINFSSERYGRFLE